MRSLLKLFVLMCSKVFYIMKFLLKYRKYANAKCNKEML